MVMMGPLLLLFAFVCRHFFFQVGKGDSMTIRGRSVSPPNDPKTLKQTLVCMLCIHNIEWRGRTWIEYADRRWAKRETLLAAYFYSKKRMAINVLTAYLFPYTKSLATRREGLKREPGDGRIINHMAFSFPSPHDAVGFSHSIYLFFSILNISHLSRSPGQRLYVIFWSFFFDFFFSLSLT